MDVKRQNAGVLPYQNILDEFVSMTRQVIESKLTGIYLHGSLAMGCFHPAKSDIDLIVIVEDNITDIQKMQFMEHVVRLNRHAPAKGMEISIVKREFCDPFIYPTPFELHFSPAHLQWFCEDPQSYIENMNGVDIDLAAHFSIINHYGISLYGEPVENVFAKVPRENYVDSIYADVKNAAEDIDKNPVYIVLNLCRVAAFVKDGLYLSKEEGGRWALEHLRLRTSGLITDALECYATDKDMNADRNIAGRFVREIGDILK
ncbi:MAG: DUF4111 domain-containing protein [Eubacterium sp.]|nr:DUF4111 domain-containing protein [Eubacterium sp.]